MRTALTLAARARAGEPLTGALIRMPNEELAEMLAVAGFDFVLIDCEHGPADVTGLRRHIAGVLASGVEVVVRVGQDEPALVLRALDAGASGILAPHIDTADQAVRLVESVFYPPRGNRGFATYGRAGGYGTVPASEHRARLDAGTLVLAMPESPTAADQAAQTLAVRGIDGYMIGVADLAASSGPEDRSAEDSCAMIHRAGREVGSIRTDIVSSRAAADRARADGAQVIVHNITAVLMETFGALTGGADGSADR